MRVDFSRGGVLLQRDPGDAWALLSTSCAVLVLVATALLYLPAPALLIPVALAALPILASSPGRKESAYNWSLALLSVFAVLSAATVGAYLIPTVLFLGVARDRYRRRNEAELSRSG